MAKLRSPVVPKRKDPTEEWVDSVIVSFRQWSRGSGRVWWKWFLRPTKMGHRAVVGPAMKQIEKELRKVLWSRIREAKGQVVRKKPNR